MDFTGGVALQVVGSCRWRRLLLSSAARLVFGFIFGFLVIFIFGFIFIFRSKNFSKTRTGILLNIAKLSSSWQLKFQLN